MNKNTKFKNHLKLIRAIIGCTQKDVAIESTTPLSTYKAWESGKALPSKLKIYDIITAFKNIAKYNFNLIEYSQKKEVVYEHIEKLYEIYIECKNKSVKDV